MVETISLNCNTAVYVDTNRDSREFLIECRELFLGQKDDVKVKKTELGAPYYSDRSCYVSLSHKKDLCVAVLSMEPVGIDVELDSPIDYDRLSIRMFGEVVGSRRDFYLRWTALEALAKLYGEGILPVKNRIGKVTHYEYNGYIVAIATK